MLDMQKVCFNFNPSNFQFKDSRVGGDVKAAEGAIDAHLKGKKGVPG